MSFCNIADLKAPILDFIAYLKSFKASSASQLLVSFGHHCIVPLLPALAAQYPELTVDLQLTDTVVDLVVDRIDIAVRLEFGRLYPDSLTVDAYPIQQPMDLANHNCLLFPLAGFRSQWLFRDQLGQVSEVPVSGRTVISSAIALQQCAIAGWGWRFSPSG